MAVALPIHTQTHLQPESKLHFWHPHLPSWVRHFDRYIVSLGALTPVANLPQLIKIYSEKSASVSLLSWSMYLFLCIPWVLYGILHRDRFIAWVYSINAVIHASIIVGILMYR